MAGGPIAGAPMPTMPAPLGAPMSAAPAQPFGGPPALPGSSRDASAIPPAMPDAALPTLGPPLPNSAVRAPGGPDASPPRPTEAAPFPPPPPARSAPPTPGYSARPSLPVDRLLRKEEAPDASAYLAKLAAFARELDVLARSAASASAGPLRLLRQRLTEWVEDLRSVGGHDALAAAVDAQVQKLSAALGAGATQDLLAIATELARLADGGAPPRKTGREGFWK
jgi:hypothetical protein